MFLDNVNTVFDLHTRNACLVIADVSLSGCLDGKVWKSKMSDCFLIGVHTAAGSDMAHMSVQAGGIVSNSTNRQRVNPVIKPTDIGAAVHNYCCLANACMNWFPSIKQPITLPDFLGNSEIGSSSQ